MAETKVSSQAGKQVRMPDVNKAVEDNVRASKPGLPYSGAPSHKMPR